MIQEAVETAVAEYKKWQTCPIGRDINPSELIKKVMAAGAKRLDVIEPTFCQVPATSVARIHMQTVTYGGIEDD